MSRPKLLDTYCCGGGAGMGYQLAGFDVTGVDKVARPNYPFRFIQADALDVLADTEFLAGFDAIHASPPCQFKALATLSQRRNGAEYPDLIGPTRQLLEAQPLPWVIENVPDTPLRPDIRLCGCMFGLEIPGVGYLKRERWFETSWRAFDLEMPHRHRGRAISIAGHGTPQWMRAATGHIGVAEWRQVMGIDWTTRDELTEAIPPPYTEYVGARLLDQVESRARQPAALPPWSENDENMSGRTALGGHQRHGPARDHGCRQIRRRPRCRALLQRHPDGGTGLMEWSKLFANLPDDPRIQAAEDDGGAGWLLVQSFCYVTRAESLVDGEGFIPDTQVRRFGCTPKQVTALVRERLYIRDDLRKGYLLDPDIWNEDRNLSDSAERKRKADRERMAAKRAAVRSELNGHLSRDSRTTHSATRGQDRPAVSRDNRALDLDLDQRRSDLSLVEGRDQPSRRNAPDQPVQLPLVAVAKLADRFAHVLDDDDLLKAVIGLINAGTGRVISAGQARGIAADILGAAKRQVSDPAAYVRKAISGEQDPAARWLDSSDTEHVAPLRPTWCGECDERTRQREKPDGTPYYCPNCNERATAS